MSNERNHVPSASILEDKEIKEPIQIFRTSTPGNRYPFLPRLTAKMPGKCETENKNDFIGVEDSERNFRLPEIHRAPSEFTRMALNRSITDLLDPEMEILNKVLI